MLRPTRVLCYLYELATIAALRLSQESVDGINLTVRIATQANAVISMGS
ncbi:MAG: hypothetical protein ABR881_16465 [Candidatus Sulfotelmatobacter sp.]